MSSINSQFEFKKKYGHYKNKKGDPFTINNGNMTDAKAVEFLRTNPERIELFSRYPENWKEIVDGSAELPDGETVSSEIESEALKEAELVANVSVVAGSGEKEPVKEEEPEPEPEVEEEPEEKGEEVVDNKEEVFSSEDGFEEKRESLMRMKLKDLRELYPDIKATSITDFVNAAIEYEKEIDG